MTVSPSFRPSLLEWYKDQGNDLVMLLDKHRNQFYDRAFATGAVAGKICMDIGFGTGMLSLLALKHGAKKVIAYEMDIERFKFGQRLISEWGLSNKIELRNEKFEVSMMLPEIEVVFHEIIEQNMWADGLYRVLNHTREMIPSNHRCDFYLYELSDDESTLYNERAYLERIWVELYQIVQGIDWPDLTDPYEFPTLPKSVQDEFWSMLLVDSKNGVLPPDCIPLDFGVELPEYYAQSIRAYTNEYFHRKKYSPIQNVDMSRMTSLLFPKLLKQSRKVASYYVDHPQHTIFIKDGQGNIINQFALSNDNKYIDVPLPVNETLGKNLMLLPSFAVSYKDVVMHVSPENEQSQTHWETTRELCLLLNAQSQVVVRHYLDSGHIRCWLDDTVNS